jgi:hypothetical protein
MTEKELIEENGRRLALLPDGKEYNPLRGIGCIGERVEVATPLKEYASAFVPRSMVADPQLLVATDAKSWEQLRCRHDFEFWCARCVTIKSKTADRDVPFVLNVPQRRVAAVLEADRLAERPLRLIMLKARQWGGSTLVQMYMAWIQSVHCHNWHSLICAHVKDGAANIRGMYSKLLVNYPPELWDGDALPGFQPFEGSHNIREIVGRGCHVTLASAEKQDAVRGGDYAMAHLSETAFWPATPKRMPEDFIRAVCSGIMYKPLTLIAIESTANGVGNYFHAEWVRSEAGKSDKHAIFVPWYEIENNRLAVDDAWALWQSLTEYELKLWERGLTLEMINWYHHKALESQHLDAMHAEYPTTPEEAFINSGAGVFATEKINRLRRECCEPRLVGDISAAGVPVADSRGLLRMWADVRPELDYVVSMDIGGRSANADWSVIAVLSRERKPQVVAQWRGHIDHDLLADEGIRIARYYNNALLVVESNTFETESGGADNNLSVLARMARSYSNMYTRTVVDRLTATTSDRVGFHTNRRTKPVLINGLIGAVRDAGYVERDAEACNELATYVELPNGAYAAKPGKHDDILMTRALALHVIATTASTDTDLGGLFAQPTW